MWYLISMDDGVICAAKTKRELRALHTYCKVSHRINGKIVYNVWREDGNTYSLYPDEETARIDGFGFAIDAYNGLCKECPLDVECYNNRYGYCTIPDKVVIYEEDGTCSGWENGLIKEVEVDKMDVLLRWPFMDGKVNEEAKNAWPDKNIGTEQEDKLYLGDSFSNGEYKSILSDTSKVYIYNGYVFDDAERFIKTYMVAVAPHGAALWGLVSEFYRPFLVDGVTQFINSREYQKMGELLGLSYVGSLDEKLEERLKSDCDNLEWR